jgi:thioredoxin-like negative regulator of GroEL
MASLVAHLARKERARLRVEEIDIEKQPELAQRFRITTVPTLALVKDKRVVGRLEGRVSAPRIEAMLEPHLDAGSWPDAQRLSSRRITARPNSAARAPSITRWSKVTET